MRMRLPPPGAKVAAKKTHTESGCLEDKAGGGHQRKAANEKVLKAPMGLNGNGRMLKAPMGLNAKEKDLQGPMGLNANVKVL